MDTLGNQFLPCAGLAHDEDSRIGWGGGVNRTIHRLQRQAGTNNIVVLGRSVFLNSST